jgi:hypothetical protein
VQDGLALNGVATRVIVIAILSLALRSVRLLAAMALNLAAGAVFSACRMARTKEKVMQVLMIILRCGRFERPRDRRSHASG